MNMGFKKKEYIGFNLDIDMIEKLKIISLITKKNRTVLIKEGLEYIVKQNKDAFEQFSKMIEEINK